MGRGCPAVLFLGIRCLMLAVCVHGRCARMSASAARNAFVGGWYKSSMIVIESEREGLSRIRDLIQKKDCSERDLVGDSRITDA